jgi:tRNA(Arg) A34 adenosine deaminase TadA
MATEAQGSTGAEALLLRAIAVGRAGMLAHRGGPFGAIVVDADGQVVGEGCNQVTSTNDPTAHAEVSAIRAACASLGTFQLDGYRLFTSCEPCPMCLAAAYWARVDEIVYGASREDAATGGFDDAFIYDEIGLPPGQRRIPMRRVAEEPAAALFREWLELGGRTPY